MLEKKIQGRFVRQWKKQDNCANLVIVHGVSEHCGRYLHVAEYFHERGFNVYTGDLVGHGLSDGARVYLKSIGDYIEDVEFFISLVDDDKPVFILGHSMGGFIALYYGVSIRNPSIRGIVVTSPYLKEKLPISKIKLAFGRAVALLYPRLRLRSGIKSQMLCRDSEVCRRYGKDPLNTDFVTVGWFVAMEKARKQTVENAGGFMYPLLMLQAGADAIVDPEANRSFYESIASEGKEYEIYEDFYHEVLNDPQKDRVLSEIYQWLKKHI